MEEKLVDSPDGTKHEYFALSSIVEVLGSRPVISTNGDSSGADYFADLGILNCTCLMHLLYGSAYLRWQFEYGCREFSRAASSNGSLACLLCLLLSLNVYLPTAGELAAAVACCLLP